jgi:hypothetical protein
MHKIVISLTNKTDRHRWNEIIMQSRLNTGEKQDPNAWHIFQSKTHPLKVQL